MNTAKKQEQTGLIARFLGRMSMRSKLLTVSITVTFLSLLVASTVVLSITWNTSKIALVDDMTTQVRIMAENSAAALSFSDKKDAERLLNSLRSIPDIQNAGIYFPSEELFAQYCKSPKIQTPKILPIHVAHKFSNNFIEVHHPVKINNTIIGTVYIKSGLGAINAYLKTIFLTLAAAIIIALGSTLLLILWLQNYITSPIKKLASVAKKIKNEKDFTLRMNRETMDEVGLFADTMNETLDAIADSEKNYREIFNGVKDAIIVQKATTGEVIDVNDATLQIYGCSREEIIGLTIDKISSGNPGYDHDSALKKIEATKKLGHVNFEWEAKKINGDLFWADINLRYSTVGKKNRILATVRDISDRKRSMELIAQTEKMMSVGGLAAGIAHEINNPLAGIIQSAYVLESRLSNIDMPANKKIAAEVGVSMEKIFEYMDKRKIFKLSNSISSSGKRAADIIGNMLSFSRKSDSKIEFESMSTLMDKTIDLAATDYNLKKKFDFKQIKIIKEYEDNLNPIPCEKTKIQQVFLNILRNGAEAMNDLASIKDFKPQFTVRIKHENEHNMLAIEIEDNGPGMTIETSSHIFEPFFTTKSVGKGTGLGLSVSYFIITDNHKGTMEVKSQQEHGSTFIIRLPYQKNN